MNDLKERYEIFKDRVLEEDPNPYYCYEGEEELFEDFKKEFPEASIHDKTGMGIAVCKDDMARVILAFEMIGASKSYAYMCGSLLIDSSDLEVEAIRLLDSMPERSGELDAGGN